MQTFCSIPLLSTSTSDVLSAPFRFSRFSSIILGQRLATKIPSLYKSQQMHESKFTTRQNGRHKMKNRTSKSVRKMYSSLATHRSNTKPPSTQLSLSLRLVSPFNNPLRCQHNTMSTFTNPLRPPLTSSQHQNFLSHPNTRTTIVPPESSQHSTLSSYNFPIHKYIIDSHRPYRLHNASIRKVYQRFPDTTKETLSITTTQTNKTK